MQDDAAATPNRVVPLEHVQTRARHRLSQQWSGARTAAQRDKAAGAIKASAQQTQARLDARGPIELAAELPITERADEITDAIRNNQVVVVSGETGSGKTTQLPKILMRAGFGARGLIGHTQPRRLAARSVAERIAEEVATPFGQLVGFKTRFDERISDATQVKLMTDGILLAESARDRFMSRYEVIIIDEAHERTLNVDFLLGYIKRLLPSRPDLKLVVTSATIDTGRFAEFFNDAPIINVEGRGFPVETRYRPPEEGTDTPEAIEQAVRELWREGPGDILVFLPGERDIRDSERHLSRALSNSKYSTAEVVPLYARLTRSAQQRIFAPSAGRRVVLATNVAETSLTVPGIRYVVDTGLARVSRYSTTAKVQRLPIEPVAQASCNQRAGRCGRVAPGVCVRLFEQDDFDARPAFTDPEIRRTNLANVLLTMADLRLGDIEDFPFIDPPERRYITDGRRLLEQLQALKSGKGKQNITSLGRKLARLPLDPRIGRMLLAGDEIGVLGAMRVVAAGLTIQDPRERPSEVRAQADKAHAPFVDRRSDFIGLLKLWDAYAAAKKEHSSSQLRKWCREHFLNFMRLREWEDLIRQLRRIGAQIKLSQTPSTGRLAEVDYDQLHQALLPGLLDYVGRLDEAKEYLGARGRRFHIFPGSGLAGKAPRWLVAGEMIETSRLFAHKVAAVEPEWVEPAAAHLVKREHYSPAWAKRRGHVTGRERVKLFGLTLADDRKVDFGPLDPVVAREIFIRDGLVAFAVTDNHNRLPDFLAHNQHIVTAIAEREARFRRRDLLVDEHTQVAFYDVALPADVYDRKSLALFVKAHGDTALRFDEDSLLRHSGISLPENAFPTTLRLGQTPIALTYHFAPGDERDGVTARLPLPALNQFPAERAEWLVQGLVEEKLREYLKALPKSLRRSVVPVPDFARAAAERITFGEGRLPDKLRDAVQAMTGVKIPEDAWREFRPTAHLQMRFELIDVDDNVLAAGRDLDQLKSDHGARARATVQALPGNDIEQTGLTAWPAQDLPATLEMEHGGVKLLAVPTLVDRGESVDLQLVDDPEKAEHWHRQGVVRLLQLQAHRGARFLKNELDGLKALSALRLEPPPASVCADANIIATLQAAPGSLLLADMLHAIVAAQIGEPPRTRKEFESLAAKVSGKMVADGLALWQELHPALKQYTTIRKRLGKGVALDWMAAIEDIKDQLTHLVFAGFISHMPEPKHLRRYLDAVAQRLQKLEQSDVGQDKTRMQQVEPWWHAYKKRAERAVRRGEVSDGLIEFRWLVEEFRVQIFAQPLGTAVKVSAKRLQVAWDALGR